MITGVIQFFSPVQKIPEPTSHYVDEKIIDDVFNNWKFRLVLVICMGMFAAYVLYHFVRKSSEIIFWTLYIMFLFVCMRCLEMYVTHYMGISFLYSMWIR